MRSAGLAVCLLVAALAVPAVAPGGAVRVLVLGDTGTGGAGQYAVASAASAVCAVRGCDLALLLGDNIYDHGVSSAYDPQFVSKFELPYQSFAIPFWAALGNHDNSNAIDDGLGSDARSGDYQVQYSARTDRSSDKWRMPARYYEFRVGDVAFFALDSNSLVWWGLPFGGDAAGVAQIAWLEQAVASSDARWKLVFAHHPYVTNGQHDDAGRYEGAPTLGIHVARAVETAVCGKADLYLAGHDHDLQWLEPVASCGAKPSFVVSGAGSKTRPLADPDRHEAYFQRGGTLGFFWLSIAGDDANGAFYDAAGNLLYERTFARVP